VDVGLGKWMDELVAMPSIRAWCYLYTLVGKWLLRSKRVCRSQMSLRHCGVFWRCETLAASKPDAA
jgi:hypothetical protein